MSKNLESELCLFVKLTPMTRGVLTSLDKIRYVLMVQGDINTTSENGLRITNRTRMTELPNGEKEFTCTTKFRQPRAKGSVSTSAPQVELDIDEADFNVIMGACSTRYVKRRYKFPLRNGLNVELDWYLEDPRTFSHYAKIDIEGGQEELVKDYLQELTEHGIFISEIINTPGVESDAIKQALDELMTKSWNIRYKR